MDLPGTLVVIALDEVDVPATNLFQVFRRVLSRSETEVAQKVKNIALSNPFVKAVNDRAVPLLSGYRFLAGG